MKNRLGLVPYILSLFTLFGAAVPSTAPADTAPSSGLAPVVLQLKWKHQFQFAGYYMAQEKGYYAAAGMDVAFNEAMPGQDPMEEVVAGRAEFGVGTTDILQMREQGKDVVVLASIFQHSPAAIMVRKDAGILSAHNLARKRLMIEPHSAELLSYLSLEGVDIDGLQMVEHTFDIDNLLHKTVDGMSVYLTDEPFQMESANVDYRLLRPIDSGIDFYGDNLFTLATTIDRHPKLVNGFLNATRKGWVYALNNMEETVDLILSKYSTRKSREHLLFEAARTKSLILSDVVEVGYMNPFRWERIAQRYMDQGLLQKDFSLDGLLYNPNESFIPPWLWQLIGVVSVVALLASLATIWVVRVNRRLRSQEARLIEANHHKEMLLSIIGHDVKNNIFSVRRYGELLMSSDGTMDNGTTNSLGQRVLFGVDAAIDILDNLLQWAMLQQSDLQSAIAPIDLPPVIHQNIDNIRPHAQSAGVTITADIPDTLTALCNSWRVDTVIRNLLNNALKFTREGDAILVSAARTDGGVAIIVEDTGVGMPEADIARVFSHDLVSRKGTAGGVGSGFGLPLCKRLLQDNNGDIVLENRAEGGLRATVTLPHDRDYQ